MKAFIFTYQTNYDLGAALIYAESKERAIELAKTDPATNYIWDTNSIYEINLSNKEEAYIIREDGLYNINDLSIQP